MSFEPDDEFPFPDRLELLVHGSDPTPAGDDWHYRERVTDRELHGVAPPVWVLVFADNAPGHDPGPDQPKRAFDIEGGEVRPTPHGDTEPTNDEYFLVKKLAPDRAQVVYLAGHTGYDNALAFDGETVIESLDSLEAGHQFQVPETVGL